MEMRYAPVNLMRILHDHYGRQVILLIDEYDVPLDKANTKGYYEQMAEFQINMSGFGKESLWEFI